MYDPLLSLQSIDIYQNGTFLKSLCSELDWALPMIFRIDHDVFVLLPLFLIVEEREI
jgi:hypothetical protein